MMLRSLSGPDRDALVGALHELLTTESTAETDNAAALDQRSRRVAEDAALAIMNRNSASFSKRWNHLVGHLEVWR